MQNRIGAYFACQCLSSQCVFISAACALSVSDITIYIYKCVRDFVSRRGQDFSWFSVGSALSFSRVWWP